MASPSACGRANLPLKFQCSSDVPDGLMIVLRNRGARRSSMCAASDALSPGIASDRLTGNDSSTCSTTRIQPTVRVGAESSTIRKLEQVRLD